MKEKKIAIIFMLLTFSVASYSQKDVTQFLGIPVDGYKNEMIQKLKAKGFTSNSYDKDVLEGQFNGTDVRIYVVTNNNKVYRIMVTDANPINETDIKIRFNRLCQQFENNEKYMSAPQSSDYEISEEEDISYEMSITNKRYEAIYYQKPAVIDSTTIYNEIHSILLSKYTEEQLSNLTKEEQEDVFKIATSHVLDIYFKKTVWFMINQNYGKYNISMYYDNEYNKANGEDL